ncbi:protein turtle homolog A isoform X2 [Microcaecilia unicolor]|uniref:Protein turtle homolog A isoform X2 n=1 Tax=Microcaecilia unicolor TaxID=1415580 RepID=A0A6P7WZU6_9AMPH|nr:protein turtle homolog A isoform X2 [Microcaecilia unicolor]
MNWCLWIACLSLFCSRTAEGHSSTDSQAVIGRVGESVVLSCDLLYHNESRLPLYVIEWVRFGFLLPIFIKFGLYSPRVDPEYLGRTQIKEGASLRIDFLRLEDQGWYECRVFFLDRHHADREFQNGTWIHLTVNSPPAFHETPPAFVEVRGGDTLSLSCVAYGNPKPSITWKRNGVVLLGSDKIQVNNGSLTINEIERSYAGVYTCHASSPEGEIIHTSRLLVQGPPVIVIPPENVTVNVSQDAFMACQAEAYPANLTYSWFQWNSNVFHLSYLQSRVRVLVDGSLLLQQAAAEDSGKYTCVPSNGLWKSPSASAYLTVLYPAQVIDMPLETHLPVGMKGVIKCPVRANPPLLFVNWTKDGHPLELEKYPGWYLDADSSVVIATGNDDALGLYACTPYNSYGTAGESVPTRVLLKDPPVFLDVPKEEYLQEVGRELVILCSAAGDPPPTVTWRKLRNAGKSRARIDTNSSLVFKPLTKEDHGTWECTAANHLARINALTSVSVLGTSPHAVTNISAVPLVASVNVSWVPGFDGGYLQRFSVWVKRLNRGHHNWITLTVPVGEEHFLVENLQPDTGYQFSVLSQNKLGSGPFSEILTRYPLSIPVTTLIPEMSNTDPRRLVSPPRFLTANETSRGVILLWEPPLQSPGALTGYALEFRQAGEGWELLGVSISGTETRLLVPGLIKDSSYEFRLVAFSSDHISDPSNSVNISTTGMEVYPSRTQLPEALPQPVLAGLIGGICFLAIAVIASTAAACFMNHRRAIRNQKRQQDQPIAFPPNKKPSPSQNSDGSGSSDSLMKIKLCSSPYQSFRKSPLWGEKAETGVHHASSNKSTSRYTVYESHIGESVALERISRGPDGRFVVEPEARLNSGLMDGFPYATETEFYPEFHPQDSLDLSHTSEVGQETYLQIHPERGSGTWQGEVTLRPKATGQARREAQASGHRQGRYFGYSAGNCSSPVDEPNPLCIVDISPVTLPYSKIEERRREASSIEENFSRTVSSLKNSEPKGCTSLSGLASTPSLQSQKELGFQTKGSQQRLSASVQSGILQYLSLPFFKEMSVDGDWPPEKDPLQQEDASQLKAQGSQTLLNLEDKTLIGDDKLTENQGQERPSSHCWTSCLDYVDTSNNQKAPEQLVPNKSFLQPPESNLWPVKSVLPDSLRWTNFPSECPSQHRVVKHSQWTNDQPHPELPRDIKAESVFTVVSSSQDGPFHELTELKALDKQKPLGAPFLHGSPSEKVFRSSLTSQSSGRGSVSFLRPPSLAQSLGGGYFGSHLGETASWHSGGGSQGSGAEESQQKMEPSVVTVSKRRNTSVDENYEWDSELPVELDILEALQLYRSGTPKRPVSSLVTQDLQKQGLRTPREDCGSATKSSSVDTLAFSHTHTLTSPEARCAALREEFLAYQRQKEEAQEVHMSSRDYDECYEQATLL